MRNRGKIYYATLFGLVLACAGILFAQSSSDRPFIVNGKPVGTVVRFGGHSYVALETVAQITNGAVTIEASRVLLNIAAPETGTSAESGATPEANAAPAPNAGTGQNAAPGVSAPGLSREFAKAAIGALAEMREWRGAVGAIPTYGVPVVGTWPQDYHDRVSASVNQAAVAATTDSDQDGLQLLQNEFNNLAGWADDVVSTRIAMNATKTVNPDAMRNDTVLTKISDCSRFLSSMLVTGSFADNSSCH